MAHTLRNKLRGLAAAFVAVMTALAIVPGAAFALNNDSTGTVTINGLQVGDTVTLYKVVDTTYNDNNTLTHEWNSSIKNYMETTVDMTIDQYRATANDAAGTGDVAASIHAAVSDAISHGEAVAYPDADGETLMGTTFTEDLPMGEYLVVVKPAEGTSRTYQNMIVSVQPTAKADGTWSNPVMGIEVAEPKFTEDTDVSKDVIKDGQVVENPQGYKPGNRVEFQITSTIPNYNPNTNWDETTFTIKDTSTNITLPASKTDYTVTGDGAPISADDYGFTHTDDHNVVFTFTGDGLKKNQGKKIVITYTGTIEDDLGHTETADNTATVNPGNDTGDKSDTVTFEFYQVTGTKVDSETGETLQGAVFSIYRESNGTTGLQNSGDNQDELVDGNVTVNENGVFTVDGLAEGDYYLVETTAPAGYKQMTGSVEFHTSSADSDNVINVGNVKNDKDNSVHLPTTGGMGTVAFTAAGVVIIAGAAAFIIRSRKSEN